MRVLRCAALAAVACVVVSSSARAQTEITIGKIIGGIGLHLPSYIAMDQGYYKAEGLNARFIELASPPMIRAGMSGNVNFVPIPSGGAQAVLKGRTPSSSTVVNQSLSSQYVFVAPARDQKARGPTGQDDRLRPARRRPDLRRGCHRTLALLQDGELGRDYKVLSLPGDPERVGALLNKDIDAAMVSTAQAIRAVQGGMNIVLRTGDHLQRVGGCFWVAEDWYDKNQDTVAKFMRAIAKGVMYVRTNKEGSKFRPSRTISASRPTSRPVWSGIKCTTRMRRKCPRSCSARYSEPRATRSDRGEGSGRLDKPLPDVEQFVPRALLEKPLKDMKLTCRPR